MKPNQINIDGVLYDLTPAGNPVFDAGKINDQLERIMAHPSAAAEPKGKEWEIVAYTAEYFGCSGVVFTKDPSRSYDYFIPAINSKYKSWHISDFKDNEGTKIHSVRRLSDNEVFAVGDEVGWGAFFGFRTKILAFSIVEGRLKLHYPLFEDRPVDFINATNLHKINPARTPLFTTTDGKPMFAGETVYVVPPNKENVQFVFNPDKAFMNMYRTYKWFSTQAAAEQWIADNKPLYSLNDILAALPDEASKEGIAANLRAKKK